MKHLEEKSTHYEAGLEEEELRMLQRRKELSEYLRTIALSASSWREALALSESYGEFSAGNLIDDFQDMELQRAVEERLPAPKIEHRISGPVHYITHTSNYGGHTELMLNIIRAQKEAGENPTILATRDLGVLKTLEQKNIKIHMIREPETLLSKVATDNLFLHADQQDLLACVFADRSSEEGGTVYFVNHADHSFMYRPRKSPTFLEVSGLGRSITAKYRSPVYQRFLGICAPEISHGTWAASRSGRYLLTIARREKLRPRPGVDFPSFANRITRKHKIDFQIVGQTGKEPWWQPYRENERLAFLGMQDMERISSLAQNCAAYIDSFPITGGTVLTTIGIIGAPIFSLKSIAYGYNAVEDIRIEGAQEFEERLDAYLSGEPLFYDIEKLYESIVEWQSQNAFASRVNDLHETASRFPKWADPIDVKAADVRRELFFENRFSFNISHRVPILNRLKILSRFAAKKNLVRDVNYETVIAAVLGRDSQLYDLARRVVLPR